MAFFALDPEKAIESAIKTLKSMSEDREIPRNIREIASKALGYLTKEDREKPLRISSAIDALNEIAEKQNVPVHIRHKVRNIIALLESLL